MFRLRNAALQTGIGRPWELLFLDLYFGLLASSRDPNFMGRHLFWLGLRVVDILHTFYSRAVIQRHIDVSPAFMEYGLAKKIAA
jgi:steroid 5-alpha reductase family enzyme